MIVERSERGALTTKAYIQQYKTYAAARIISTQWTVQNNQIISYNWSWINDTNDVKIIDSIIFQGTDVNNDDLEFGIIERQYGYWYSSLLETQYFPVNTEIKIPAKLDYNVGIAFTIYVRRADGGILTPSDMERSVLKLNMVAEDEIVQTTAIPQNWLETTTASFQNPMDTYTTIIPTDYDISSSQYDPLLEIPSKIDTAINFIILGFGRIMNFRYISFVVCFVLIVGLVAWLIH